MSGNLQPEPYVRAERAAELAFPMSTDERYLAMCAGKQRASARDEKLERDGREAQERFAESIFGVPYWQAFQDRTDQIRCPATESRSATLGYFHVIHPCPEERVPWEFREREPRKRREFASDMSDAGYVYVFKSLNLYKVGISRNVKGRLRTVRSCNHAKVEFLSSYPVGNMKRSESILHREFKDKRFSREWFRLSAANLLKIEAILKDSGELKGGKP